MKRRRKKKERTTLFYHEEVTSIDMSDSIDTTLGNVVWQAQADLISRAQHDWHKAGLLHILKSFTFFIFLKRPK
jgi:hypothetical protein